jgi:hypothetical protein
MCTYMLGGSSRSRGEARVARKKTAIAPAEEEGAMASEVEEEETAGTTAKSWAKAEA